MYIDGIKQHYIYWNITINLTNHNTYILTYVNIPSMKKHTAELQLKRCRILSVYNTQTQ
jgi:hypothetical protein